VLNEINSSFTHFLFTIFVSPVPGWEFTKLLTQILNIFLNFGPQNLEIIMTLSSFEADII